MCTFSACFRMLMMSPMTVMPISFRISWRWIKEREFELHHVSQWQPLDVPYWGPGACLWWCDCHQMSLHSCRWKQSRHSMYSRPSHPIVCCLQYQDRGRPGKTDHMKWLPGYSLVPRPLIQRVYRLQYNARYWKRSALGLVWVWDRD